VQLGQRFDVSVPRRERARLDGPQQRNARRLFPPEPIREDDAPTGHPDLGARVERTQHADDPRVAALRGPDYRAAQSLVPLCARVDESPHHFCVSGTRGDPYRRRESVLDAR